jgi:ribosomal protein S18 acetylase RimI-like enzyme
VPEVDVDTISWLGHLNYLEFGRFLARCSGRAGTILEEGGMVFHAPRSSFPVLFNGAWRVDPTVDAHEALSRADAFFGSRSRGYSVNLRDGFAEDDDLRAAAESAGLIGVIHAPEMVRWQPVDTRALPDGVALRWVRDEESLGAFVEVNESAYTSLGMPVGAIAEAITDLASFTAPTVHSIVAYLDGEPVAAAQTILSHSIAGVYFVGTVERARGSGLGDAVTRAVTNRAFDAGARAVTLQASAMGEPIYLKMGYQTIYHYTTFARFEPAAP